MIAGDLCGMHYARLRRLGTLEVTKQQKAGKIKECREGDGKPALAYGLCSMHYLRLRRTGTIASRDRARPFTAKGPEYPLPATRTREQWLCWAAGFFDGEGCIVINKDTKTRHYGLQITVSQTEASSIQLLQALFGGFIREREAIPAKNHRKQWSWGMSSQGARIALEELLPSLVVKRRQAELAIELGNDTANRWGPVRDEEVKKRERIKQAISRLNKGVPEIP